MESMLIDKLRFFYSVENRIKEHTVVTKITLTTAESDRNCKFVIFGGRSS